MDNTSNRAEAAQRPEFLFNSAAWRELKENRKPDLFANAWFDIVTREMGVAVKQGVVVLGTPDKGPFSPVAIWPASALASPGLVLAVESAITSRKPIYPGLDTSPDKQASKAPVFAIPLLVDQKICGALALELDAVGEDQLVALLTRLEWGAGWFEVLIRRSKYTNADQLISILELVASGLHYEQFQAAVTSVATELANKLGCERVSIGFLKKQHAEVAALSHNASFSKTANLIRDIEHVMDEAIDQQATIIYPVVSDEDLQITREHQLFHQHHGGQNICTVPFSEDGKLLGAILLERNAESAFDAATVGFCEHAASLLGPLLDIKRKNDRWLVQKAADSLGKQVADLLGPKHAAKKLSTGLALFLFVFFLFAEGDYRVTANARLEGALRRAISVPMAGYIAEAHVRAGDIVRAGEPMFTLDDRDLRLEKLKWESQKIQHRREHSEALAQHETAKVLILKAQIEQAEAQLSLIDEQLNRIRVIAPFDSVVVMGDLSQSLGAPLERGEVVFEVAPLNDYRVVLRVDERDIGDIKTDQGGQLVLSGVPGETFNIRVTRITPVSSVEEGLNFFKVEAQLEDDKLEQLRPGMEGIGKVSIEPRKLAWIWTHRINQWLRMFFWSWWP